ncbi:MAG: protein kinase domain-containing protein, partial [Planctomycetota bacterium]
MEDPENRPDPRADRDPAPPPAEDGSPSPDDGPPDETTLPPWRDTVPREDEADRLDLESGDVFLGSYRVVEEIGRGGMGAVYRGVHDDLRRTVALKVLIAGEDASDNAIERFRREAEAVAKLGLHPNIVPVYDIGRVGKRHFFAMHFVEGDSLDWAIERGELSPRLAAEYARKLAAALQHAHDHAILHRDVKPENVLIDTDGEPKLTDFGLAKDVELDSNITLSGTRVGTPRYMAPEQADARHADVDHRTDVWGLGATLYAMLTAFPPFDAPTLAQIFDRVTRTDPVAPRKRNPAVPKDLETICLKALEKEPHRRYGSAGEMGEDLQRFIDEEPIMARPVSLVYHGVKRVKRNPAFYVTLASALLILTGLAVFFLAVKPALDLRRERRVDREALSSSLGQKRAPLEAARKSLASAKEAFEAGRFAECAEICDRIEATYGPNQGSRFTGIPHLRHPELLEEPPFPSLKLPNHFPLAAAASAKARALQALGDSDGARGAWARAYWRARQEGVRETVEEARKDREVLRASLLALGEDLLARAEFRRARGAFEEVLGRFPEATAGAGTLGLARVLQNLGDVEASIQLYRRFPAGAEPRARTALALLESIVPRTRFPLPLVAGADAGSIADVVPQDLDGDGRDELLLFENDLHVTAVRFDEEGPKRIWRSKLWTATEWKGGLFLHAVVADPDRDGRKELLLGAGTWNAPKAEVSVFEWEDGSFRRAASHVEPGGKYVVGIAVGNLTGDDREEILVGFHTAGSGLGVFRYSGGGLQKLGGLRTGSAPKSVALWGAQDRKTFLLSLGEFTHYRIRSGEFDPVQGSPTFHREAPAFRSNAHAMTPVPGSTEFVFSVPSTEAGDIPWWSVVRNVEDDPEPCLEPGVYTVELKDWPEGKPREVYRETGEGSIGGGVLTWTASDAARFAFVRNDPGARKPSIYIGPLKDGGWIRIPTVARPAHLRLAELDGDPGIEVLCTFQDGSCLALGFGTGDSSPNPPLAGTAEGAVGDPALAIARSLAEMGSTDEAAGVFALAAEEARTDEVRGAALLGRADVLVQAGQLAEAIPAFLEAVRSTSARGRAVPGLVWILEMLGRWAELHAFLEKELTVGRLPPDVTTRMRDLHRKTRALARLRPAVRLGSEGSLHPLAMTTDPLTVSREGGGFALRGDASRGTRLVIPMRYSGETFRLEADFSLDMLDWATGVRIGVVLSSEKGDSGCLSLFTGKNQILGVHFDPWYATSFPLCQVRAVTPWGGGGKALLQEYPPAYPKSYGLALEYSRELKFWRVELRDDEGTPLLRRKGEVSSILPKGRLFLIVSVARSGIKTNEPHWREFRAGLTVKRAELLAPWHGAFVDKAAGPHGEDALWLANGHLAADRFADAEFGYGRALDGLRDAENAAACLGDLPGWPGAEARLLLFRGVLRFRGGKLEA